MEGLKDMGVLFVNANQRLFLAETMLLLRKINDNLLLDMEKNNGIALKRIPLVEKELSDF